MRGEEKRAIFLIGDQVELHPPNSASRPDLELRGIKSKIKAVQFGSDPEFQPNRNTPPGAGTVLLAQDLWLYRLDLGGNLGSRKFREDWIRPA